MALFPRIQSPCPYKDRLGEVMVGDMCSQCDRQVHDITDLSDTQRLALVAGCKDEICVSYRLVAKTALAAAAMGAALGMPVAAAADTVTEAESLDVAEDPNEYMEIIVGGLKTPKKTVWIDTKRPANLAELPVVYEDAPAAKPGKAKPAKASRGS
jgi:hypothetical protein